VQLSTTHWVLLVRFLCDLSTFFLLVTGGIAGLIFDSPNADDGDYIETSPIVSDASEIDSGYVVKTASGSRYFLSPDKGEKEANTIAAFRDLAASRRGGTITITKETREALTKEAMKKLEKAKPRSTFSLMDLFGPRDKKQEPAPRPTSAEKAPSGVPTLSSWSTNDDGTITGLIYGSKNIDDGDLVTTSPIAQGTKKKFQTVTTISGSLYFLG
jgi:hypothetical protein